MKIGIAPLLLPIALLGLAACGEGDAAPSSPEECVDCPLCPAPETPPGCPESRVAQTIDLVTGCPVLVCGACPAVEQPQCSEGRLVPTLDRVSGCPVAWTCERCAPPPAPACPGGYPVAGEVDDEGCTLAWRCASCPEVEAPRCADATEEIDPSTGCVAGWNCPECPETEPPACTTGAPILETDPDTGCSTWVCPPCPEVEPPACTTGDPIPGTDPATGCATWSCPPCPEVERPECTTGAPVATTDPRTGCPAWACPACPDVPPPSCGGATPIVDGATGCTTGWDCPPVDPDDRWAAVDHLSGHALVDALQDLIDGHTNLGYDGARDRIFTSIDVHDGKIECIYTGRLVSPDGTRTPGGFNTEHSWPQSEGATGVAKADLHHLFPTDATANNRRGSYPFGDTDCNQSSACVWYEGGSELGNSSTGGGRVFEVRPAYRGDIARAHFYFSVRYGLAIPASEETVLRAWHQQDPVSDRERLRNDRIEAVQHNRNPFVDRPDFVARIADF